MRILQISNRVPWPLKDGGTVAIYQLMKGLRENGCEIDLIAMNTSRQWIEPNSIPEHIKLGMNWELVPVDNAIKPVAAFLNLFSTESYNVSRFKSSLFATSLESKLKASNYDIIHLEGTYTLPYLPLIRKWSSCPVVLRTHNIEYKIWQTLADHTTSFLKKHYLQLLANRLQQFELKMLPKTDALVPITETDAAAMRSMGCKQPIHICPTGIDTDKIKPQPLSGSSLIFHLGAMDWMPNQEGLRWFVEEVWDKIIARFPDAQCELAGKSMPAEWLKLNKPGIRVLGEVPDANAFMEGKDILIIPLFSGSGLRIKMLEGMALGKAIVTTDAGVAGIPAEPGKHFLLANTPEAFAQAVLNLLENQSLRTQLGANARQMVEEKFNHQQLIRDLLQFYRRLI